MIVVRLCGGIGNQMFQYAAARRLALVRNVPLKLDLGWFENIPPGDTHRQYELHVFNSVQDMASSGEVKAVRGTDTARWPKVAKRLLAGTGLLAKQSRVMEKHFRFDPEVLLLQGDVYLDGFWQSEKYFKDAGEAIRKDFTIRYAPDAVNSEFGDLIQGSEAVSIHVRRGDYVTSQAVGNYHGVCSHEYYISAIAEMTAKVNNPHFFVFSDDPGWVKANLKVGVVTYLDHNGPDKAYEDLRLMSLCKHHIIANSSFSWWGAWLSRNPQKVVIAPRRWFNRDDIDTSDLIAEGWLRL